MRSSHWTVQTKTIDRIDAELKSVLLRLMLFNNDIAAVTDTINR